MKLFFYILCFSITRSSIIYHCGIQSCVHCNSMADGTHGCFLSMGYPILSWPQDLFKQGHTRHVSIDGLSLKGELLLQLLHSSFMFDFCNAKDLILEEEIHLILYCNVSLSHIFYLCLSLQLAGRLASSGKSLESRITES